MKIVYFPRVRLNVRSDLVDIRSPWHSHPLMKAPRKWNRKTENCYQLVTSFTLNLIRSSAFYSLHFPSFSETSFFFFFFFSFLLSPAIFYLVVISKYELNYFLVFAPISKKCKLWLFIFLGFFFPFDWIQIAIKKN